jgi:hypothetical protein
MEEVISTTVLHDMFAQMSSLISGADEIMKELDEEMPNLAGLQFVVLHYYKGFVSPSNFQGYALLTLTMVPEKINDIIVELLRQADDEELGKIVLLAARDDVLGDKTKILKGESNRIIQARVKTLRGLKAF